MSACACTLFFRIDPEELAERYEAIAEPPDGYLTRLHGCCVLVDAASEVADWAHLVELATPLTADHAIALSVFIVGAHWALALARDGQAGPVAAYTPDQAKTLDQLPHQLLALEGVFDDIFHDDIDRERIDQIFGALLEGAVCAEDALQSVIAMLGVPEDWMRWSWYETIPEQIFLDPDLAARVIPLGAARELWDE